MVRLISEPLQGLKRLKAENEVKEKRQKSEDRESTTRGVQSYYRAKKTFSGSFESN